MTQQVVPAVSGAPVITGNPIIAPPTQGEEPTIEELAALVPEDAIRLDGVVQEPPVVEEVTEAPAETPIEPEAPAEAAPAEPAPDVTAAAERAAKAAAAAREGSRRYAEAQRMLAEQNARVQRAAREAEMLRQENEAARQRELEYQRDPYAALKKRGMTDVDLAQRALREGTPEAATLRLEQALASEREARVALERRLESERAQMAQRTAESQFIATAKDASAYPELAARHPEVQLTAARAAIAQIRANGHETSHLTTEEIAEAAELWLAPTNGAKKKAAAVPAPVAAARPSLAKTSGKTLTNAQAQTRTSAPAGWDTLTEEQQLAHIAASLPEPVL